MIVKERLALEEELAWAQHEGRKCGLCDGTGEVDDGNGEVYRAMECPRCGGYGWVDEDGNAFEVEEA